MGVLKALLNLFNEISESVGLILLGLLVVLFVFIVTVIVNIVLSLISAASIKLYGKTTGEKDLDIWILWHNTYGRWIPEFIEYMKKELRRKI